MDRNEKNYSVGRKNNYLTLSIPDHRQSSFLIKLALLILITCIVSIDAAIGQKTSKKIRVNGRSVKHKPRVQSQNKTNTCVRLPNRTIDGTCNNIDVFGGEEWGATDIPLHRKMLAAYGLPDYHNDMSGNCRLSPRAISNLVCDQEQDILSPRNLSSFVFTWGQFLDHDIDLTPESEMEYQPILLPANEPLFTAPIPFFRSEIYPGTGTNNNRQQENILTSWVDASQVYGSDSDRADWLRTFSQGKLKTSEGNLLPYNTIDGNLNSAIDPNAPSMAGDDDGTNKVFVAGDVRANEQPGLTSLHTLFVREHNRICNQLINQGMNNDEQIYQRARKMVGALMQSITYNEFLPALGVSLPFYEGYDSNVRPDITNLFATAAYRLGHTMVTNEIPLLANNCDEIDGGSIPLLDGFFNPDVVATYSIAPFLQGFASQTQQKVDTKIVDNLRNFLFGDPGSGATAGLDLASLNLQRGRDHGLPDYASIRAFYTGDLITSFSDITSDTELQSNLQEAYGSVYDMDVWVGLLAEDPLPGSSIGPGLNAILGDQFQNLRVGDYYYFENDPAFSPQQRFDLNNTTLSEIIQRNTNIDNLQSNVFFADSCDDNGGGGNGGGGNGGGGNGGGGNGGGGNGGGGNGGGGFTSNGTLEIAPNPSDGQFNFNVQFGSEVESFTLSIQNLEGKTLYSKSYDNNSASFSQELNLRKLAKGVYVIIIQSGSIQLVERLIVD